MDQPIVFDIGHVVVKADHELTINALRQKGVREELAKNFFFHDSYIAYARGEKSSEEYAADMIAYFGSGLRVDDLLHCHDIRIYEVDTAVMGLIGELYATHGAVHFLTNTNPWQTDRVENQLIPHLSQYGMILRSHELRKLKADPGCFDDAASILGAKGILIDDSSKNVEVARASGWGGILYESPDQLLQELRSKHLLS